MNFHEFARNCGSRSVSERKTVGKGRERRVVTTGYISIPEVLGDFFISQSRGAITAAARAKRWRDAAVLIERGRDGDWLRVLRPRDEAGKVGGLQLRLYTFAESTDKRGLETRALRIIDRAGKPQDEPVRHICLGDLGTRKPQGATYWAFTHVPTGAEVSSGLKRARSKEDALRIMREASTDSEFRAKLDRALDAANLPKLNPLSSRESE